MNIIDIIQEFRCTSANKNLNDLKMTFQFNSPEKIKYKTNAKQRKLSTIKALRAVVL